MIRSTFSIDIEYVVETCMCVHVELGQIVVTKANLTILGVFYMRYIHVHMCLLHWDNPMHGWVEKHQYSSGQ